MGYNYDATTGDTATDATTIDATAIDATAIDDTTTAVSYTTLVSALQQGINSAERLWQGINWTEDEPADLLVTLRGTDGDDHLRNVEDEKEDNAITGAFMGFSGDDVLYSQNLNTPMLLGGSGNDSYILENEGATFIQVVENGNDDDDKLISYDNDWAWAGDINGQHLILADEGQSGILIVWNYQVPQSQIENFYFDFDRDGFNTEYSHSEFIGELKSNGMWLGSFQPELLGISSTTINDLAQTIAEANLLSEQIEDTRVADNGTKKEIARLHLVTYDEAPDLATLNEWVGRWETENLSYTRIAEEMYLSDEFTNTYGLLSDHDYVSLIYQNTMDRTATESTIEYFVNHLENGASRDELITFAADALELKLNTELELTGLIT